MVDRGLIVFPLTSIKYWDSPKFRSNYCVFIIQPSWFKLINIKPLVPEPLQSPFQIMYLHIKPQSSQNLLSNLNQQIRSWTPRLVSAAQVLHDSYPRHWQRPSAWYVPPTPPLPHLFLLTMLQKVTLNKCQVITAVVLIGVMVLIDLKWKELGLQNVISAA
jgi:hypothetical protein